MSNRIFITGATGYVGGAVAARLARAGHEVIGLTRHEERAPALEAACITPVVGDLSKPEGYVGILKNCDAAVHAAIDGEAGPSSVDMRALDSFREAATDGRLRRLIYTSALWVHGDTGDEVADETRPLAPAELVVWRAAHEDVALDLADHHVEPVILRLGMVYGESRGILGPMFAEARDRRIVRYPGDGTQHWAMVHRDDVAEAYALALEHAAAGERYLLVDGATHTAREVAEAIAVLTGAEAQPWPADEVVTRLGAFGKALLQNQTFTAMKARRDLGWVPRHASFVKEVAALRGEWEEAHSVH